MINYIDRYNEYWTTRNTKTKKYIGVGTTVLWVFLLIVVAFIPALTQALDANNTITAAQSTRASLKTNVEKIRQAKQIYNQQEDNIVKINQSLPTDAKPVTVTNELDLAVGIHNLVLENLTYKDAPVGKNTGRIENLKSAVSFTVNARGTYKNIREFVQHLEELPRVVLINQININQLTSKDTSRIELDGGEAENTPLSVTVSGNFYYNPPEDTTENKNSNNN